MFDPSDSNFFAIETFDENGNRIFRQLRSDEIVLLSIPTDSLLAGWGTVRGLPLTPEGEIDILNLDPSALRPLRRFQFLGEERQRQSDAPNRE